MGEDSNNKVCPECGKRMIKTGTGVILATYPAQHPQMWWCGCGHAEEAETLRGKTVEQLRREEWEDLNR